jgi:hypothetical protein
LEYTENYFLGKRTTQCSKSYLSENQERSSSPPKTYEAILPDDLKKDNPMNKQVPLLPDIATAGNLGENGGGNSMFTFHKKSPVAPEESNPVAETNTPHEFYAASSMGDQSSIMIHDSLLG